MRCSAFALVSLLAYLSSVNAANDWTVPCNQGRCSYDMPQAEGGAAGSISIWGSPGAIADITQAGGWMILDCDKTKTEQDIRLVCKSDDAQGAGCDLLDQNGGAEGKIVRLPESCGANAFARVARSWVHEDQSLPEGAAPKIARRQNAPPPQVRGLTIDTKFSEAEPKNGEVMIAIEGTTIPGQNGNFTVTPPTTQRRSRIYSRNVVSSFISRVYDSFLKLSQSDIKRAAPVKFKGTLPIFEQQVKCGAVTAKVKGSAGADVDTTVVVGVGALGTLTKPAKLSDLGITIGIDGTIEGSLTMSGNLAGSIDGTKELFSVGLPGLSFPGLFEVGPFFKIEAKAEAKLDVNADLDVGFKYRANDVRVFFPRSDRHPPKGQFTPEQRPLSLSISPSVASSASVEGHFIPKIALGVNGLGNKADIFIDLDSRATVKATLKTSAKGTLNVRDSDADIRIAEMSSDDDLAAEASSNTLEARQTVTKTPADTASAEVNGCLTATADLSVNLGAESSFLGLFDKENKIEFPVKKFTLFETPGCAKVNSRELHAGRRAHSRDISLVKKEVSVLAKRRLECTATTLAGNVVSVVRNFLGKPTEVTGQI
ncbi:hypothetical protein ONZ45_g4617 [Pleurotus djamor]|nr:hypothetical protein ONZ45_g4617 [Pleurotus djamor]